MRYGLLGSASTGLLVEILDERVIGRALAANQGRDATISLTVAPVGGFLLGISTALVAPLLLILDLLGLVAGLLMRKLPAQTGQEAEQDTSAQTDHPAEDAETASETLLSRAAAGFRWLFSRSDALGAVAVGSLLSIGLGITLTTQTGSGRSRIQRGEHGISAHRRPRSSHRPRRERRSAHQHLSLIHI